MADTQTAPPPPGRAPDPTQSPSAGSPPATAPPPPAPDATGGSSEALLDLTPLPTPGRSAGLASLAKALSLAQAAIKGAVKDSKNPYFKNKYASLNACWDACREALSQNELSVFQFQTPRANPREVVLTTLLLHSSGEWIESVGYLIAAQNTPQSIGGCITYARRYGLGMVGVSPDEDDDGTAASNTLPDGVQRAAVPRDPTPANRMEPQQRPLDALSQAKAPPPLPVNATPPPPGKPPMRAPGA